MNTATKDIKETVWYDPARRHRGSINEIAEASGCHRNWVRLVLKGFYFDDNVLNVAATILVAKESKVAEFRKDRKRLQDELESYRPATAISAV